jgi:hypothetical protein
MRYVCKVASVLHYVSGTLHSTIYVVVLCRPLLSVELALSPAIVTHNASTKVSAPMLHRRPGDWQDAADGCSHKCLFHATDAYCLDMGSDVDSYPTYWDGSEG